MDSHEDVWRCPIDCRDIQLLLNSGGGFEGIELWIRLGVPAQRVYVLTFGIGFALAALGGVVAAPITTVEFRTGVDILPFCFMAVIIGGLGMGI